MCNPPFYASSADLLASAASKSRPPRSACTGADVEMVTPGGEVAFVSCIIAESKRLGRRCQWYTSLLGKSSSIEPVVERLKEAGADNWAATDLVQGYRTRRWAIAWSWGSLRPTEVHCNACSTRVLTDVNSRPFPGAPQQFRNICFHFHPSVASLGPTPQSTVVLKF